MWLCAHSKQRVDQINEQKLSGEIMTQNYELAYYLGQNVGILGILAYPKTKLVSLKIFNLVL